VSSAFGVLTALFCLAFALALCGVDVAQDITIALVAPSMIGFAIFVMTRARP
jgi:hypothetical protein